MSLPLLTAPFPWCLAPWEWYALYQCACLFLAKRLQAHVNAAIQVQNTCTLEEEVGASQAERATLHYWCVMVVQCWTLAALVALARS